MYLRCEILSPDGSWVGRWKCLHNRLSSITMNTSDCPKSSLSYPSPIRHHTLNVIMKMKLCSGENIVILFNDFYECSVSCSLCNPITRCPYNDSFMDCPNHCCAVIVIYWNGYIYDCHQYVSHSYIPYQNLLHRNWENYEERRNYVAGHFSLNVLMSMTARQTPQTTQRAYPARSTQICNNILNSKVFLLPR